jgi:hypothetical protein
LKKEEMAKSKISHGKRVCSFILGLSLSASLALLMDCESEEARVEKARIEARHAEERERIEQEKRVEEERVRKEKLAETAKIIEKANSTVIRLKPRFNYKQDKFDKTAIYTQKNFGNYRVDMGTSDFQRILARTDFGVCLPLSFIN